MVGRVSKGRMYDPLKFIRYIPDLRAARLWFGVLRNDRRSNALLRAVARELQSEGIRLIDSTRYIPEQLAQLGPMTRLRPSLGQLQDVRFGLPLALRMGELDVGQSIAVKDREVIAVEAVEGTDRMIERAGKLCRSGGWTLIKVAKPIQDMSLDVPTVGPQTIEKLRQTGARCLACEAQRVIMLDREEMLEAAERAGIAVLGVRTDARDPFEGLGVEPVRLTTPT
jgi:DUF1009 family protein